MWLWNYQMWVNKKRTIECDKRAVICDIGTDQCNDGTVKYEKKIRVLPNVIKVQSEMMLVLHNVIMELPNVRKKKGITNVTKV